MEIGLIKYGEADNMLHLGLVNIETELQAYSLFRISIGKTRFRLTINFMFIFYFSVAV